MRDTGGGFGQKVVPDARRDVHHARRPKVRAPLKWIEDRRENLLAAGQARHEHGDVPDGVRRRRRDPGRRHRLRPGRRRVPDAVAGAAPRPRSACCSPGRTGCPRPASATRSVFTNTAGAPRTAGRGSSRRSRARCCSTSPRGRWASIRSSCAAATCCAATSCRTPTPTACPTTTSPRPRRSSRPWRSSTTKASARSRQDALAQGRYLGVGFSAYVEPTAAATGYLRHRGRDDPHRAVREGQRLRRRRLDRQQPRDHRRPADRRRARRRHRRRRHDPGRHRCDTVRRGHQGSRSGSMTAGAVNEAGTDPARADRRDRRAPARSRASPTSSWRTRRATRHA